MTGNEERDEFLTADDRYVAHLGTLQLEISRAIEAIAANDVVALEQTLRNQEALCCHLRSLTEFMSKDLAPSSIQTMQIATAVLERPLRTFVLLLEQAGANAQQLYCMCRSYTT